MKTCAFCEFYRKNESHETSHCLLSVVERTPNGSQALTYAIKQPHDSCEKWMAKDTPLPRNR